MGTCQGDAILGLCILSILLHCVTLGLIVQIKYMQRTTLEPAIKKIVKESYDEILEAQKSLMVCIRHCAMDSLCDIGRISIIKCLGISKISIKKRTTRPPSPPIPSKVRREIRPAQ